MSLYSINGIKKIDETKNTTVKPGVLQLQGKLPQAQGEWGLRTRVTVRVVGYVRLPSVRPVDWQLLDAGRAGRSGVAASQSHFQLHSTYPSILPTLSSVPCIYLSIYLPFDQEDEEGFLTEVMDGSGG